MSVRSARGAVSLLALVVLTVTPAQAQQRGAKRGGGGGAKYALLVGVRKYNPNELRSLPYSEPDVVELADVLKAQGYKPGNVVVMTQTTGAEDPRFLPLAANVRAELKLLLADMEEEDSVLIALAGHGVQFRGQIENYFCPADAKLADKSSLIALSDVYKQLESCRAGLKLLLVDACRNDPQSDNSRSRSVVNLESVTRPQRTPTPGGVLAFFSCSETEKAYEHSDLKHGVFFYYVIEGLRGAAVGPGEKEILIPDLEKYVKRNVRDFVREKYGVRQMPELRGTSRDLVPLVVRNTVVVPDPAPLKPAAVRNTEGPPTPGKLLSPAELADYFAFMATPEGNSNGSINIGLWVASPFLERDRQFVRDLVASKRSANVRLVALSLPKSSARPYGVTGVTLCDDPRQMLDLKSVDAIIIHGLQRPDADVPELIKRKAPTAARRVHLFLMWACQAGKDGFLIIPDQDRSLWKPARLGPTERLASSGEGDAVEAAAKYAKVVWAGLDFKGFFACVRSRDDRGAGDLRSLVK